MFLVKCLSFGKTYNTIGIQMPKNCYLYSHTCDDVFLNEHYKFLMQT